MLLMFREPSGLFFINWQLHFYIARDFHMNLWDNIDNQSEMLCSSLIVLESCESEDISFYWFFSMLVPLELLKKSMIQKIHPVNVGHSVEFELLIKYDI